MELQSVGSIYLEKLSAVQRVFQEKTGAVSEGTLQPQEKFDAVLQRVMAEEEAAEAAGTTEYTSTTATLNDDLANLGLDPNDPMGLKNSSTDSLNELMKTMQTMMVVNMQQKSSSALFSDGGSSSSNDMGFSSMSDYSNTIMMTAMMDMLEGMQSPAVSATPLPAAAAAYTQYDM